MADKADGKAQENEAAPEAIVIANAIHDLADAIRLLASAQMPDEQHGDETFETLSG